MTDHRVKFDFTVYFTNGGSLSAEDFRLDIPWKSISDETLSSYLIRDMRLLMAGKVEIRNKEILHEAHKRSPIDVSDLPDKTIDLANSNLATDELLALVKSGAIRVIGPDGESYLLKRLVV